MADLSLENLRVQIQNLSQQTSTQDNKLALDIATANTNINNLSTRVTGVDTKADGIEAELHILSTAVNTNKDDIVDMKVDIAENKAKFAPVELEIEGLQTQLDDMDVEHHKELHKLAAKIDNNSFALTDLETYTKAIPTYEIVDEQEYANLGTPDTNVFYFVKESD